MADDTAPRDINDRPSVRTWTVPTTFINEHGEEVPNLQGAEFAQQEVTALLMRVGGVASCAAKRVKLPPQGRFGERYETEMILYKWQSHTPAQPKVEMGGAAAATSEDSSE